VKRWLVIDRVEKDGRYYDVQPPLECEVKRDAPGWGITCDLIEVAGCESVEQAFFVFESLLQECIVDGEVKMMMENLNG